MTGLRYVFKSSFDNRYYISNFLPEISDVNVVCSSHSLFVNTSFRLKPNIISTKRSSIDGLDPNYEMKIGEAFDLETKQLIMLPKVYNTNITNFPFKNMKTFIRILKDEGVYPYYD